jgi:hypothetical protein
MQQVRQVAEIRYPYVGRQPAQSRRAHPGGPPGGQAGRRVLHHQAPRRRHAEPAGRGQVPVGVRFPAIDVLRRDEQRGNDAGGAQASLGKPVVGAGDDRPRQAQAVEHREQVVGPVHRGHAGQVVVLQRQLPCRRRGHSRIVQVRQQAANGRRRGHTVRDRHGCRGIDAVLSRPDRPGPLDGGVGVDQGAVHVQQDSRDVVPHASSIVILVSRG